MKSLRTYLVTLGALVLVACGDDPGEGSTENADTEADTTGDTTPSTTLTTTNPSTTMSTTASTSSTTDETDTASTGPDTTSTDPTTTGDGSGSSDGSTSMAESSSGDTTGAADDTIYEIQDGTIAEGTDVDVQGVIITGMRDQVGMFVQEPDGGEYSGVYVDTGDIDLSGMAIGDEVDITGVTSEGFGSLLGLTAIDASGGTVVATGNGGLEPAPTVVDLSDLAAPDTAEPWEGVLVMVDEGGNVVVSAEPGFDEFEIEAGGDAVLVDNFLYNVYDEAATFPGFGVGAEFETVAGPLNFSFDAFKIAPRSEADLPGYVGP